MKRKTWIVMLLTMLTITLVASFSALADAPYSEREMRELAQRNGYEQGFSEGREDRRDRRSFDYRRNHIYREGTLGYRGYRGAFYRDDDYREAFRQGFENGYRNAYYQGGGGWGWGRDNDPWWGRDRYDRDDCDVSGRPRNRRR